MRGKYIGFNKFNRKMRFQWGIAKSDQGLTSATEIVQIIRDEVKAVTVKLNFFTVEDWIFYAKWESCSHPYLGEHSLRLHPPKVSIIRAFGKGMWLIQPYHLHTQKGYAIRSMKNLLHTQASVPAPDIVVFHVGTNDLAKDEFQNVKW